MGVLYKSLYNGDVDILMYDVETSYVFGLLPEDGTLIEWGCGGSTIYFLDHLKEGQFIVSVEHNEQWYNKISDMIKDHPNIDRHAFLFIPPTLTNSYYARPEEEMPCGLDEYICPDVDLISNAKVFLIDGIARGPIAAFLSSKVTNDAHVLIHDYPGRELWYDWATKCYNHIKHPDDTGFVHMSNSEIK